MENEVTAGVLQFKISFISIFVVLFLFISSSILFGVTTAAKSSSDSNPIVLLNEEQNMLFRTEPWRIGVTEILLNIENPQSDDYLVYDYLSTLLLEQIKLFNIHVLNEKEIEYLLKQNLFNFEGGGVYDYELFSRVYSSNLDFLRNQEEMSLPDSSSEENNFEKSIIESGRIPVTIVTNDKEQYLPYINYGDKVTSLVVSKEYNLESIISSEIDKIGKVYIYRMFRFSPAISEPIMLFEFSFTKNTLYTIDNKILDALSSGIGGYLRSTFEIKTDVSDVQVLIDNDFYSISDIGLKVLPPGEYEIHIFSKKNSYHDINIYRLEPGKITTIEPFIPFPEKILLSLSIYPFYANIITESQIKSKTPSKIRSTLNDQITLFSEAGGYISQNLVISNQIYTEVPFSLHLRPAWMGLDSELNYGQISFYNSLAASILSLPASVLLYGLASEYNLPIYQAALGASLAINISLLLDTIISLVDYYHRTEVL